MRFDWSPLRNALSSCRTDGTALPFWWRDDDAVAATPALDRLADLAEQTGMSVHLAIVPAHAENGLITAIASRALIPIVHGWAHRDHSDPETRKNEFLTPRTGATGDTQRAMDRMRSLFGTALAPMFVPPWNRINPRVVQDLHAQGYTVLSTFGARAQPQAAPGLAAINTHIDPIWWKGTRDLVDPDTLIARACAHLDARRAGTEDAREPLGLLTHHLVHTNAIWDFTTAFVQELLAGGATPWKMERPDNEQT